MILIVGILKQRIRTKISEEATIKEIPQIIIDYFNTLQEVPDTNFIVAGYNNSPNGEKCQMLYKLNIKNKQIESIDTSNQDAIWDGETYTLSRLLQNIAVKTLDGIYVDLLFEEILWGYFALQDAVDFARYAVETTIQTMHFKNVIETVGGSVDILVITPDETKWLQKEILK